MNHTSTTPDSDGRSDATPSQSRLGADGRPIVGPVTTTSD
jgi:hypothetical protein